MPAKRRFRPPCAPLHAGHRAVIALTTAVAVLGLGPAPVLANTGSVYVDTNVNTAAGFQFFNGTFTGQDNVGIGNDVMPSLTTGNFNLAAGEGALTLTTSGNANAASGYHALHFNTTGHDNAASGTDALAGNTTGSYNVASGGEALSSNTTGNGNVASGYQALGSMFTDTGSYNVANGYQALYSNTAGNHNIASGSLALYDNTQGNFNLGIGNDALSGNTIGSRNIGLGQNAGTNLTTGSDNIDIANPGAAGEAGTIRIGTPARQSAAFLAGVWNKTASGPTKDVVINAKGRLATAPAPAPSLQNQARTIGRLRDTVRQQSVELRQQGAAIQRLRKQMENGA